MPTCDDTSNGKYTCVDMTRCRGYRYAGMNRQEWRHADEPEPKRVKGTGVKFAYETCATRSCRWT
jgi:hypothetical protein